VTSPLLRLDARTMPERRRRVEALGSGGVQHPLAQRRPPVSGAVQRVGLTAEDLGGEAGDERYRPVQRRPCHVPGPSLDALPRTASPHGPLGTPRSAPACKRRIYICMSLAHVVFFFFFFFFFATYISGLQVNGDLAVFLDNLAFGHLGLHESGRQYSHPNLRSKLGSQCLVEPQLCCLGSLFVLRTHNDRI
jgi:hypothetical protein